MWACVSALALVFLDSSAGRGAAGPPSGPPKRFAGPDVDVGEIRVVVCLRGCVRLVLGQDPVCVPGSIFAGARQARPAIPDRIPAEEGALPYFGRDRL